MEKLTIYQVCGVINVKYYFRYKIVLLICPTVYLDKYSLRQIFICKKQKFHLQVFDPLQCGNWDKLPPSLLILFLFIVFLNVCSF